jgi:SHS2 domain-containing protein
MPQDTPFEVIEHTADVGIIAYGSTLEDLFENAARGMFSLMAELGTVRAREERQLAVSAEDWEGLMAAWLSELLYYVDAEGLLLSRFQIERLQPFALHARVAGEPIDP